MKAAERLGTGASFGNVPRGRSARGRAKAITQGDVPSYELVRLHLDEVAPTPLNPRRNFGTDEEKTRFGEELRIAQLAACVAIDRAVYLELWPEHAEAIGTVQYVLVNGERRYRSGQHVGLDALDFVIRNDLASTREDFINFLLKENLDREDFDVIERARGVLALVDVCSESNPAGAQTRAAERLAKSKAWVTNQLALLSLPDEIQLLLSSSQLPERDGRLLARHLKSHPELEPAQLLAHLALVREQEAQVKQEERSLLAAAKSASVLTAVNTEAAEPTLESAPPVLTAVNTPAPPEARRTADERVPTEPAPVAIEVADPGPVLPHQSPSSKAAPKSVDSDRAMLEKLLGSTPAGQASVIAAVLSTTELKALITALQAHL